MSDLILISDEEAEVTPPSKKARKNPTPTILNLDSDPTPQKQPPGSASTPLFIDETPISEDVTVIKSSFGSSHRESKFSGKFDVPDESFQFYYFAEFVFGNLIRKRSNIS